MDSCLHVCAPSRIFDSMHEIDGVSEWKVCSPASQGVRGCVRGCRVFVFRSSVVVVDAGLRLLRVRRAFVRRVGAHPS